MVFAASSLRLARAAAPSAPSWGRLLLPPRGAAPRAVAAAAASSALAAVASTAAAATRCEEGGGGKRGGLPRDGDGNIDWGKAVSSAREGSGGEGNDLWHSIAVSVGESFQAGIDSGIPTQLSYGFVSGYCSGYALKKVGKTAAFVFGLGFMSLQTLSYYGYVKVDHGQIRKDVENLLDLNDDGRVDGKDGELAYNHVMKVLQFNLPGGSGFAAGFVGGLRSG
jgi:uncharacterized membrane protein (Fun14 family)